MTEDTFKEFYLIRKNINGGFGIVLQTSEQPILTLSEDAESFDSVDDAADSLFKDNPFVQVRVHVECIEKEVSSEESLVEATELILRANAELIRLYRVLDDIGEYADELALSKNQALNSVGLQLRAIIKE